MNIFNIIKDYLIPFVSVLILILNYIKDRDRRKYINYTIEPIIYDNKKKFKLIIWNPTRYIINGSDFSSKNKLSIILNNDETIENIKILEQSDIANNVSIKLIDNVHIIYFDYLNSNDGFSIELETQSDTINDINIVGSIPNGKIRSVKYVPFLNKLDKEKLNKILKRKEILSLILLGLSIMILLGTFFPVSIETPIGLRRWINITPGRGQYIISIACVILWIILFFNSNQGMKIINKFPKNKK